MIPSFDLKDVAVHPTQAPGKRRYLLKHLDGKDPTCNDYVLEIDHTTFSNYLECERKGLWNMIHARTSHRTSALAYGSAIHRGLEQYYRGELNLAKILEAAMEVFVESPPEIGAWRTPERCAEVLKKYISKYSREDTFNILKHEDTLVVEQAFREPLCVVKLNAYTAFDAPLIIDCEFDSKPLYIANLHIVWTGVIDLIVEENGRNFIVDHKTTSVEGPSYWKGFELSPQFIGYCWAASKIVEMPVTGAIANVIYGREPAKSAAAQKSQGEKAFLRQHFYYRQEQIDEWEATMKVHAENFAHNLVTGSFPMHAHQCVGKFGTCPYHDVCSMPKSQQLTLLMSDQYATNVWNPLDV